MDQTTPITQGGTSILSVSNLLGERQKYDELESLAKILKPNVILLNGNLLPPCRDNPDKQVSFCERAMERIGILKAHAEHVLWLFAGTDTRASHERAAKLWSGAVLLNGPVDVGGGLVVAGCPYVMDTTGNELKDWVAMDGPTCMAYPPTECPISTASGQAVLLSQEGYEDILAENCSISSKLPKDIHAILPYGKKLVLACQQPPVGLNMSSMDGSYDIESFVKERGPVMSAVVCGFERNTFFDYNWRAILNGVDILQPNQHPKCLFYTYSIFKNHDKYHYHPMEKNPEILTKAIEIYNGIHNAKTNQ